MSAGTPSLAAALQLLGEELARDMDVNIREDIADMLSKLAARRGNTYTQGRVMHLLDEARIWKAANPQATAPCSRKPHAGWRVIEGQRPA